MKGLPSTNIPIDVKERVYVSSTSMRIFNYIFLLPTILMVFCAVNVAASPVMSRQEALEHLRKLFAKFPPKRL
ncbi:unnamed protein product [Cylicocyclus nassatus]|uniref:Transmembrane protein n=1 Tax=Cylicocyclus nassatus TaxID=53992 RepID=A0AA36HAP6_CYLNA|nr:unnamed protein product [Cylicocyclus nassatus]